MSGRQSLILGPKSVTSGRASTLQPDAADRDDMRFGTAVREMNAEEALKAR